VRRALAPLVALIVAGCGGGSVLHQAAGTGARTPASPAGKALPHSGRPVPVAPIDPAAISVIRGWANALRRGNVGRAASYFAIPSVYANGVDANGNVVALRIRDRAGAVVVNRDLPCGAVLISTAPHGPYVRAFFRLTGRPGPGGTSCQPGAGSEASTFFLIRAGKIVDWIRGPDLPGAGGGAAPGSGNPTSPEPPPTTTPGGGVPVA
jgi:hypothetical protein